MKGQLHIHTTCSDGRNNPQEVADIYKNLGFDFIVYTDHDHLLKPNYRREIQMVKTDLLLFLGIELTVRTRWGYVHVSRIEGEHENLFIFNHPADYGVSVRQVLECIEDISDDYRIDAVEVTHLGFATPEFDTDVIPFPKVATDDSHDFMGCGRAWVEIDCKRDKDSILKQIRKGNFSCGYARGHPTLSI
ncbi:MAG TPA: hypothetical protein VHQ70_09850 [Syntrophomonadaceae bacterium]|nr:hypothetical protein [Syntrophomonadaceae bacterium]